MAQFDLMGFLPEGNSGDAVEYLRAYPSLARAESWRWTPLALLSEDRQVEVSSYQFDFPEKALFVDGLSFAPELFLKAHLDAPFAALNWALSEDTLSVRVPEGVKIDEALNLHIDALGKRFSFSRVCIELEKGAQAHFWLDMRAERGAVQLPLLLFKLAEDANLEGVLWLGAEEATSSGQLAYAAVEQAAGSRFCLNAVMTGADLARLDVEAHLKGDAANFMFGGVQMLAKDMVGDFHVRVRHEAENCPSTQTVRSVLKDRAQGFFDGMIYVAHGAQKTDARQDSRFILLSNEAKSQAVPRLEIYADDVQCAHGSTVGFLDPESLFYLRSRGVDKEEAQKILIRSFLHEAVLLDDEALAERLHDAISEAWSGKVSDE